MPYYDHFLSRLPRVLLKAAALAALLGAAVYLLLPVAADWFVASFQQSLGSQPTQGHVLNQAFVGMLTRWAAVFGFLGVLAEDLLD